MAYDATRPFTYGVPDGTYVGRPTTASCFEKDGRLILDVNFAVKDPETGAWKVKDNGYEWEAKKRHWLTSRDGGFNEATIAGLKEWAKGWDPQTFGDFFWFQGAGADGTPFGNLKAVGEVELNFQTDANGSQSLWVHDPDRPRGGGRKAFVPDGANADAAALAAKWGAKAKALFAATPKKVGAANAANGAAQTAASAAPQAPAAPRKAPARPAAATEAAAQTRPWAGFPQTSDGAFAYYESLLGEPYSSEKHDERWFEIYEGAAGGKDPDQLGAGDVERLFAAIAYGMKK